MSSYTPTIGIEVHAELRTKSKMFCGCANDPHSAEANSNVCPVCMAHPGTLPTVNKEAVRFILEVGTALEGELADFSEFDRKNYFYPDIPKAYQLSQYEFPFVRGGELAGVAITRVHLEEDTARSIHDQGEGSLVDYNRAGVPLMELVTEPVIHSAEQAGAFTRELQILLRNLGVSDANMERGEMRVEANISISKDDTLGTKVEVKNLNSFKAMESAIAYEITRQQEVLEKGGTVIQETRGWDENRDKTFSQRKKETADDYRYFPEPDIPKFMRSQVADFDNTRLNEKMANKPQNIRDKYSNLGLTSAQTEQLLMNTAYRDLFEEAVSMAAASVSPKLIANYLLSDVAALVDTGCQLTDAKPKRLVELLALVSANTINSRVAKDLLKEVVFEDQDPEALAEERGLVQKNNEEDLIPTVDAILKEHSGVVDEYKGGKEPALQFLVGQGMKATKGAANPGMLAELIKKRIG